MFGLDGGQGELRAGAEGKQAWRRLRHLGERKQAGKGVDLMRVGTPTRETSLILGVGC